jgi:hypothetical protein
MKDLQEGFEQALVVFRHVLILLPVDLATFVIAGVNGAYNVSLSV